MPAFPAGVSAVILAGGKGARLQGADKGLRSVSGKPLIAWVTAALQAQVTNIAICANRNLAQYAQYARVISDAGTPFRGPMAGVLAALKNANSDWVLTVPVDCPRLPSDLVDRLYQAACQASGSVVHDGKQRQPLFALYSRSLEAAAAEALNCDQPVWRFQEESGMIVVDFSDVHEAFVNLNTADDFVAFERGEK